MKNSKIKQEIKRLSAEQLILKPQRKTKYFPGDRTVEAHVATDRSNENKKVLRHLFMAYDVLRGKEVTLPVKREFHQSLVDKYVEDYKEDFLPKTEE